MGQSRARIIFVTSVRPYLGEGGDADHPRRAGAGQRAGAHTRSLLSST